MVLPSKAPVLASATRARLSLGSISYSICFRASATLAAPLVGRLFVAVVALAPQGLLMGMPFPKGLALLEDGPPALIGWAWGVNGAVSVVASILAALLALSFGFSVVLGVGAICYIGAGIMAVAIRVPRSPASPRR